MLFTLLLLVLSASSFASTSGTTDLLPRHAGAPLAFVPIPKPPPAPKPPVDVPGPNIIDPPPGVPDWQNDNPSEETEGGFPTHPTEGEFGQESSSSTFTATASSTSESTTLQTVASESPSKASRTSQPPIPESTGAGTTARIDLVIMACCLFACIYHASSLL